VGQIVPNDEEAVDRGAVDGKQEDELEHPEPATQGGVVPRSLMALDEDLNPRDEPECVGCEQSEAQAGHVAEQKDRGEADSKGSRLPLPIASVSRDPISRLAIKLDRRPLRKSEAATALIVGGHSAGRSLLGR